MFHRSTFQIDFWLHLLPLREGCIPHSSEAHNIGIRQNYAKLDVWFDAAVSYQCFPSRLVQRQPGPGARGFEGEKHISEQNIRELVANERNEKQRFGLKDFDDVSSSKSI